MRIAFVGKGGSGKTRRPRSSAGTWPRRGAGARRRRRHQPAPGRRARHAARRRPPLGAELTWLKDYLRGDQPRIASAAEMIKTTPPGAARGCSTRAGRRSAAPCAATIGGVRLRSPARSQTDDLGVACYHGKIGAVELLAQPPRGRAGRVRGGRHDGGRRRVRVRAVHPVRRDVLVSEPTGAASGLRQYAGYAAGHGVACAALGNKVAEAGRRRPGCASSWARAARRLRQVAVGARGRARQRSSHPSWSRPTERAGRAARRRRRPPRDRAGTAGTVEFHVRNATAWATDRPAPTSPPRSIPISFPIPLLT